MFNACVHYPAATGKPTFPIYKHACGVTHIFEKQVGENPDPRDEVGEMFEQNSPEPIFQSNITKTMGANRHIGGTWTTVVNEPNPMCPRWFDHTVPQSWAIKYGPFGPCHIISSRISLNMVVAMSEWGGSIFCFNALNRRAQRAQFYGYSSRSCLCNVNDVTMGLEGIPPNSPMTVYPIGLQTFPMLEYVRYIPAIGLKSKPIAGTYDFASHIEYDLNMQRTTLRAKYHVNPTDPPSLPIDYVVALHRDRFVSMTMTEEDDAFVRDYIPTGATNDVVRLSMRAHHSTQTEYGFVGPVKGVYNLPGRSVTSNYACGVWISDIAGAYEFAMTYGGTKSLSEKPIERMPRGYRTITLAEARLMAARNGIADYQNGLTSLCAQTTPMQASTVVLV
jgi:hypothetical protein